jgi:hypothetical protein|tara:strand:- start:234240 stop:234710 length:471 start_codon:yes stop_codon:yes gene_type:complete
MLRIFHLALSAFLFLALTVSTAAPSAKAEKNVLNKDVLARVFSAAEKNLIGEYYQQNHSDADGVKQRKKHKKSKGKSMPPGLAKKEDLPPGLARHITKNGRLPPGIEKRDLPADLLSRLPSVKSGTKRLIIGHDIVLIDETTSIILDIMKNVVFGE